MDEEEDKSNSTAMSCFKQWQDMFLFLYGSVLSGEKLEKDFAEIAGETLEQKPKPSHFLFVLFSYYTLVVTLICAEILSASWKKQSVSKRLVESPNMRDELEYLLRGSFFRDNFNITNYIEDFFNFFWFLDVWDESIESIIRPIIKNVSEFDFLLVAGLYARDVLRGLYEEIVPPKIRHDLGEVYTPDWLVELALNEAGYDGNVKHKILDPGCGRGVFLAEAINRFISRYWGKLDQKKLFEKTLTNIVGFDINPVAVLTARTNYIIALSPMLTVLKERDSPIVLPIFMTDSILTPTIEDVEPSEDYYKIPTSSGLLKLPRGFVRGENLSKMAQLLRELSGYPERDQTSIRNMVLKKIPDIPNEDAGDFPRFYKELKGLNEHEYNALIYLMESLFAPLKYQHYFDFVVGNPPWIKWEFLAEEYKNKLKVLYLKVYKLFSHGGMKAGIGYAHDDISIVFTYVALDKYLKPKGKFAFVLKQTLYKSVAGMEFRKFHIDKVTEKVPVKVLKVHDLVDVKPFEYTQSETSLIVMEKGLETTYPVPYYVWKAKDGKSLTDITEKSSLKEVLELVDVAEYDAHPDPSLENDTAPWVIVRKGEKPTSLHLGKSPFKARHGIVDDLDQVFQVEIVRKPSAKKVYVKNAITGRRKVKQVTRELEPGLIYPLLKPKYVKEWIISGYDYVVLPQRKYGENNEKMLMEKYPETYKYLSLYRTELQQRSSRWFKGRPFYTVFGLGEYTFSPHKVVWSAIGYLPAFAVASCVNDKYVGRKTLIPDNTIGFIPLNNEDEAHFVCALLNSRVIKSIIAYKSTKSKWGVSVDLINALPLVRFVPNDAFHSKLTSFGRKAKEFAEKQKIDNLSEVKMEIDGLSEAIIRRKQRNSAKEKLTSWIG